MHISKINDLYSSLQKAVDMNMQIYWVCPSIGEEEKDNNMDNINNNESPQLASIYGRYSELVKHLGEDKVIFVHGKLKASEKEAALAEFANGNKQILLATTVIEVGINVPNATIMIIEQAERFGLAQLHQIRGRVGRSEKASHCILIYYNLHEISKARLEIMEKSNDGFVIAKKDLALRGGGEVVGKKQSGFNNSTFGDINYDIIERAKDYLEKYIKIDNNFSQFNMLLEIFNIYAKEDNDLMH